MRKKKRKRDMVPCDSVVRTGEVLLPTPCRVNWSKVLLWRHPTNDFKPYLMETVDSLKPN